MTFKSFKRKKTDFLKNFIDDITKGGMRTMIRKTHEVFSQNFKQNSDLCGSFGIWLQAQLNSNCAKNGGKVGAGEH